MLGLKNDLTSIRKLIQLFIEFMVFIKNQNFNIKTFNF